MSYIKEIVNFFFHHNVSGNIKRRVYDRMLHPSQDQERDNALRQIWNGLEASECNNDEIEKNLAVVENILFKGKKEEKTIVSSQSFWHGWGKIAAVWTIPFIMLCASAYFYFSTPAVEQIKMAEVSYIQHYASEGTHEEVTLPDGSEICLNGGSMLMYPSTFPSSGRWVYLIGEAHFDVAKDKKHPLTISTVFKQFHVLGTQFNVSAYPEDSQIKATLETGRIMINVRGDSVDYYLDPNNQLVYTPRTGKVETHPVLASDFSDWRKGELCFNDIAFADAMSMLERTYGVKIHIQNSSYDKQRLRAHFNKNESLGAVLQIIKMMIPYFEYQIVGKDVYIE